MRVECEDPVADGRAGPPLVATDGRDGTDRRGRSGKTPRSGTVGHESSEPTSMACDHAVERVDGRRQPERAKQKAERACQAKLGEQHDAAATVAGDRSAVAQDEPPALAPLLLGYPGKQLRGRVVGQREQCKLLSAVDRGDDPRRPAAEPSAAVVEHHWAGVRHGRNLRGPAPQVPDPLRRAAGRVLSSRSARRARGRTRPPSARRRRAGYGRTRRARAPGGFAPASRPRSAGSSEWARSQSAYQEAQSASSPSVSRQTAWCSSAASWSTAAIAAVSGHQVYRAAPGVTSRWRRAGPRRQAPRGRDFVPGTPCAHRGRCDSCEPFVQALLSS